MSNSEFFIILFFSSSLFGLIIGAYFGTIEYRILQNLPLVTSNCFCPACGRTLSIHHQIPIISFILLRGKCHFCHTKISLRYPLIEGGFMAYYGASFLVFRRTPIAYLLLWYIFIGILLFVRGHSQRRSLLKGLAIMTLYHAAVSLLYLALYLAFFNMIWLPSF